ncbi:MAG TPA: hypothetical protein DCE42_26560, partial [Myxococcales bacterium]|nr:hypothetical protein [Myxococcales bacterium]
MKSTMWRTTRWSLLLLGGVVLCWPALAQAALQVKVLPEHFLRRFDPVTATFNKAVGPQNGGAEDRGERYLRIRPSFPGAYRWLDSKTLEFRPAKAWPALSRMSFSVPRYVKARSGERLGRTVRVIVRTLLPKPVRMLPAVGSRDVKDVRKIQLDFSQILPERLLKQALRVELRPSPGVKGAGERSFIPSSSWRLKRVSSVASSKAEYLLLFTKPLPKAHKVTVQLDLALRAGKKTLPLWEGSFFTQMPFRLRRVRCQRQSVSIGWGKSRYSKHRALHCGSHDSVPTLVFSRSLGKNNPGLLRRLIRVSPTVPGLRAEVSGKRVAFKGRYRRDVLYQLTILGQGLSVLDDTGQRLQHKGRQVVFFYMSKKRPFLRWKRGKGILEKNGPQMMPLHARGIRK